MSSSPGVRSKTRVAIVGCGIGGLTCALALGQYSSLEVSLYESAPKLAERGAGITIWARTWEILKKLGLEQDLVALLPDDVKIEDKPTVAFQFRKADQGKGLSFYELKTNGGSLNYHRGEFQQVLLRHISSTVKARIHLGKRLVSFEESEQGVELVFADGSRANCDVMVAADGIKSVSRRVLLNELARKASDAGEDSAEYTETIDPIFSGTVAYRGLVSSKILQEKFPNHRTITTPTNYWGKNKHLIVYPISQGRLVNVVAFCSDRSLEGTTYKGPWVNDTPTNEFASNYASWEEEVRVLVENVENPTAWAIHALKPLKTYVSRRVALLGDAAHAMTPHQGAGAGQAIDDAFVLSALLGSTLCNPESIPQVLQAYNAVRQPFGNRVVAASRAQGLFYEFNAPGFEDIHSEGQDTISKARLEEGAEQLVQTWVWLWTTSATEERNRALKMLEESTKRIE
ncbi:hypothetical protein HGRIS_010717 [Hohenbuehelia grisea]|uniref:FAD-binding domain-containing protein n=1 Tax=Hohenbuehelia grisea TaxID=104357 RepID=A0ABR3IYE8_9AGAR